MYKTDILEMHRAWARHRNPLAGGSANLADLSKLKNENAEQAARIKTLEDRIAQFEKANAELTAKVAELTAANEALTAANAELEKAKSEAAEAPAETVKPAKAAKKAK